MIVARLIGRERGREKEKKKKNRVVNTVWRVRRPYADGGRRKRERERVGGGNKKIKKIENTAGATVGVQKTEQTQLVQRRSAKACPLAGSTDGAAGFNVLALTSGWWLARWYPGLRDNGKTDLGCRSFDTRARRVRASWSRPRCPFVAFANLRGWANHGFAASSSVAIAIYMMKYKENWLKFFFRASSCDRGGRVASLLDEEERTRAADHEWPGATVCCNTLPRSEPVIRADGGSSKCSRFLDFQHALSHRVSIYTDFVIRIFWLYTDYTTNAGAITMFLGWTKLWEEDVERVWGSFETGKWLWWVCRRRRAEIAGALERLVLAECPGDDSSVRAESSVDGARRSVDHSNTTVVSAKASAVSGGTTTHNSDGTCK